MRSKNNYKRSFEKKFGLFGGGIIDAILSPFGAADNKYERMAKHLARKSSKEALAEDWYTVADDFCVAFDKIKKENAPKQEKKETEEAY